MMRPYQKSQIGAAMWKRVWGQKVFVLAWSGAAFAMVMLTLAGIGHAEDRVAATDLRVERHPTLAGTYMAIMKIKNIGSTPWSNIPYRFMDNGQPVVSRSDTRTVRPQEETTVSWSFPLSPGSHAIVGIADPGFTLGEREGSERYNNALSRTVEVPPQVIAMNLIEVESISFDPPQPVAGQRATVKMRIKNVSPGTLANVPWSVWTRRRVTWGSPPPSVVLRSEQRSFGPGNVEVAVPWTPYPTGTYDVVGEVDPQNTLRETEPERANNRKQQSVSVASVARAPAAQPSPSPPPPRQCPKCVGLCFSCKIDVDCGPGFFCCDGTCVKK